MTPGVGFVALLTLAALGPYTPITGVRTEQVAVYAALLYGVMRLNWTRARAPAWVTAIAVLLGLLAFVAILGTADRVPNLTGFVAGNVFAGLDNLLLPIATIGAVWLGVARCTDLDGALRVVCRIVVWAAVANTAVSVLSLVREVPPGLANFWENGSGQAVAERAVQLGRFTGIFNQPAEAGLFYGMALLAAVFLYREHNARLTGTASVIVAGGVLTVSKVFLLVGLPVGLVLLLRGGSRRGRRLIWLAAAAFGSLAAATWSGAQWTGGVYLARLFVPAGGGNGMLDLYTAGRLGGESTLRTLVESMLSSAPWFGVGAGGLSVAYDNGWVEAMVVAGLAGAVLYTLVLGCLFAAWWRSRRPDRFSDLLGGLVLLLAGASVGLPALTANRVATIAWILVVLLLSRPQAEAFRPQAATATRSRPVATARTAARNDAADVA